MLVKCDCQQFFKNSVHGTEQYGVVFAPYSTTVNKNIYAKELTKIHKMIGLLSSKATETNYC